MNLSTLKTGLIFESLFLSFVICIFAAMENELLGQWF